MPWHEYSRLSQWFRVLSILNRVSFRNLWNKQQISVQMSLKIHQSQWIMKYIVSLYDCLKISRKRMFEVCFIMKIMLSISLIAGVDSVYSGFRQQSYFTLFLFMLLLNHTKHFYGTDVRWLKFFLELFYGVPCCDIINEKRKWVWKLRCFFYLCGNVYICMLQRWDRFHYCNLSAHTARAIYYVSKAEVVKWIEIVLRWCTIPSSHRIHASITDNIHIENHSYATLLYFNHMRFTWASPHFFLALSLSSFQDGLELFFHH